MSRTSNLSHLPLSSPTYFYPMRKTWKSTPSAAICSCPPGETKLIKEGVPRTFALAKTKLSFEKNVRYRTSASVQSTGPSSILPSQAPTYMRSNATIRLPLQVLKHKLRAATYAAQNSFLSHGIRAGTRTPWTFANGWDYLSDPEDAPRYSPVDTKDRDRYDGHGVPQMKSPELLDLASRDSTASTAVATEIARQFQLDRLLSDVDPVCSIPLDEILLRYEVGADFRLYDDELNLRRKIDRLDLQMESARLAEIMYPHIILVEALGDAEKEEMRANGLVDKVPLETQEKELGSSRARRPGRGNRLYNLPRLSDPPRLGYREWSYGKGGEVWENAEAYVEDPFGSSTADQHHISSVQWNTSTTVQQYQRCTSTSKQSLAIYRAPSQEALCTIHSEPQDQG
ncbi:uncharacterized protein FFUJ_06955 [Fusarium fujikuroi IMI 58289]|uniref:Uncharacterized protein n=1 Tax=Gibberella fujikuroi (strain CBS 195.34 / IMI 58289 / NRRL A-6831) TaxID=1279085 RepID=S0E051_GIBF5|nr:uncharacterized protein FFUJ_06955 [Fusarium fujikuroi IMI 58289]CCT68186.1 uncharacterized protein FFUJ_06955 [Fusarium fujikuroi IMI 58289]SCN93383.1 uncharacterized protein FFM5_05669 [Fusarium fujikuroi]SCO46535.1 uncharacterized protein FFMR_08543 [Fusarium fujikuroi]